MSWPTSTDYYAAVQHLRANTGDEELRGGEAARTPRRKLLVWTGNFADVYRIDCLATGNSWALKCFTREVPGLEDRYRLIAAHLQEAKLPFTVDFQWLEQGLRIHGQWFPALKMRWVEGLTLTQYVEKYLEQSQNLRLLLGPWGKLAAMLREAEIAHADLQHGNVLLVPTGDSLALRLIDYDGMWVPALAGSRSGEVGHPAYQHPQRLREGTYNAHVDRFPHLAIYTAIRCLMVGRAELWRRFSNGDNLLFREQDFRNPGNSQLLRALWRLESVEIRSLVGQLILACGQRLEDVPWIDKLVSNGQARELTEEEEDAVAKTLAAGEAARETDDERPTQSTAIPTPSAAGSPLSVTPQPGKSFSQRVCRDLIRPIRAVDHVLGRLAGEGNHLLRNFFRLGAAWILVVCIAWTVMLGVQWGKTVFSYGLQPEFANLDGLASPQASSDRPKLVGHPEKPSEPTSPPPRPLGLKPIGVQTVEAGKLLGVPVSVEDAERWKGRLRFSLALQTPPGAHIDSDTGLFTWMPNSDHPAGRHDVVVSVEGPNGHSDRRTFTITVTRPLPLDQKEIAFDLGSGVKLELVRIPAGEFLMGDSGEDNTKPVSKVRITKPFYLGKYEVTQEQWQAVMGNNPSNFKGPKNPVESVSWDDCQAFLGKLNEKYGGGGVEFRLPMESQWEYACRAGSTMGWCFGNDESSLGNYAWHAKNSGGTSHPVGEKKPNSWGLHDICTF